MIEIILFLITLNYVIFIGLLIYGYSKITTFESTSKNPTTRFSIVVPFRNEGNYFLDLLNSITQLNYPKDLIEIIAVDDASQDTSVSIYNKWRLENGLIESTLLENLRLTNSPKKDAIMRAIPVVNNDWVISTDADCVVPNNWLSVLDAYIQSHDVEMVVGAVKYETKMNPLHYFQQMDLMSLQGTTIGSFGLKEAFMCNGANFAYSKKLFVALNGFSGNENRASGDDVFLLQKAVKYDFNKVHYLKSLDFIVHTKPENNFFALFMQRVRWASKTTHYDHDFAKGLAVHVLLMNVCLVLGLLSWLINTNLFLNAKWLVIVFGIKFFVDFILLFKTNHFLRKGALFFPLLCSLFYPFFSSLVGIYSLFGSFSWKKRVFRK
jgi:glycosyltransferase involved in cell wall biosynthesis